MYLLQLQSLWQKTQRLRASRIARAALAILLVLGLALPAAADKANSLYKKGKDAEARQNWDQAFENYKQAYDLKPKDLRYRAAYLRVRFAAASAHVHRGTTLRDAGQLEQALAEFQRAVEIDPGLPVAQQEVQRTRLLIEKATAPAPQAVGPPTSELGKVAAQAKGPAELKPISNLPINLKITEDSKVIYTTIGKLAGINVLFDPDYVSRRITIELNNVTLDQALEIVALESKTFWRPVTSNTIFVASDTKAKRTELEQNVVKTFYLSNLSTQTELQDVVNTLRTVVEITRLLPLPSQGAIVVRGTPDQVALAEKLIGDLDKAKPEVIVEVAVMQVRRDRIRELGINPPTSGSVQLQGNVQTQTTTTTGTTGTTGTTTPTTTTTPGPITLNKLANLTSNDFVVTIPGASASFLFSDANTKIIQSPQIRSLNGVKATLKIGDRVPVATGSFQPGIGGVGINPLVNTQFQYIDVGVNMDITPTVHLGRDVSMKIMLEVSQVTSQTNIGGISQPVIGQRRVEHEIRLHEGEVSLIGGILENQEIENLSGYPWLSQVPILKYLFSQTRKERHDNEIVFALIPHIVRAQMVTDLNLRPLDVGTANAIELRRGTESVVTPPPPGGGPQAPSGAAPPPATAPAPAQQMPPPAMTPAPQQQPTQPQPPAAPGAAILSFDPPQITQPVGSTFTVNVVMNGGQNVYSVPLLVSYDPKILQLVNVSNGNFLSRDSQPVALVHREDANAGTIQVSATRPPGAGGVSGQGIVFTLTFLAKSAGQGTLTMTQAGARDPAMQPLPVTAGQAMVTVK